MGKIPRDGSADYTPEAAARRRDFVRERTGAELTHVGRYSFDPGLLPGNIENFTGAGGMLAMAAKSRMLVCLLPLTPDTRGVIDARLLNALPRGAFLLNPARGGHVVDADLLAALESDHIAGAALDVFEPEPLPSDHAYWAHPKVVMTPHAASITIPESVAPQVVENIHRARAGRPFINLVDFAAGY